ncbi:MAG: TIGR02584 family CRISPR-associated protein [Deltaproteobacteria bacterium]|nr:TIGR02584 family CRISPR-associated protein [Deltaproteobacteria bacterium]
MKTILLAVCGLSPQVITETLYALAQERQRLDAVRVLTTRQGRDVCIAGLFRCGDGAFPKFLKDYAPGENVIDFAPRHLLTVRDENGAELDDITSEEDNERFLRLCMEQTFGLTYDPRCRVLFSIAGGRKTMGACLATAAQCYARPQDRIYHVLVKPAVFESCRDFWYPPKEPALIEVRNPDGKTCFMKTSEAEITLVPMPFFPLREQLTPEMLQQPESPTALMLSLVREEKPELVIDLREKKLTWKGKECDLKPSLLTLYALLALHKRDAECGRNHCRGCDDCYLNIPQILERQDAITRLYLRMCTREPGKSGIFALEESDVQQYRSKINKEIDVCFGEHESRRLRIESLGGRLATRYGIPLDRERIRVVM